MHSGQSAWRFSSFFSAVQQLFPHAPRHKRAARCPDKVRDIFLREIAKDIPRRLAEVRGACKTRAGRRLGKDALALIQCAKIRHEMLIGDGKAAFGKVLDHMKRKARAAAHGKAVRRGAAGQTDVLHTDAVSNTA